MTREQFKDVLNKFRKNVGRGFGSRYYGLIVVDLIPDLVLEHDSIRVIKYSDKIILIFDGNETLTIQINKKSIVEYYRGFEIPFMVNFSKSVCTDLISYNRSSNTQIPIYFSNEYY